MFRSLVRGSVIADVIRLKHMNEETRLERQRKYLAVCRERGWLGDDGEIWPDNESDRTEMARGLFGLAWTSHADGLFADTRKQIGADSLCAGSDVDGAIDILNALNDNQKTAILTLMDDVFDTAVHVGLLTLDRFDHGHIQLSILQSDQNECSPPPNNEIAIISDDHNELFQDALQWKEEFSSGTQIGRREPDRD